MILSLGDIDEITLREASVILPWSVDVVLRVSQEFYPVSNPASHTRNCE